VHFEQTKFLNQMLGLVIEGATSLELLQALRTLPEVEIAEFYLMDADTFEPSVAESVEYPFEAREAYRQYYYAHDTLALHTLRNWKHNPICIGTHAVDVEAFRRTEYFNDFLKANNLYQDTIGAVIPIGYNQLAALSMHPRFISGTFSDEAVKVLSPTLPLLQQVFHLHVDRKRQTERQIILETALGDGADACVLVDRTGTVLWHTDAAFNAQTQSWWQSKRDRIVLACVQSQSRLQGYLKSAFTSNNQQSLDRLEQIITLDDAIIAIRPHITEDLVWHRSQLRFLLTLITKRRSADMRFTRAKSAFGVTNAEAEIVCQLAEGRTISEIAQLRGRSVSTVRTQLYSAMEKMDCSTQGQMVAKISTL